MRSRVKFLPALVGAVLLLWPVPAGAASGSTQPGAAAGPHDSQSLIVAFKPGTSTATQEAVLRSVGATGSNALGRSGARSVQVSGSSLDSTLAGLRASPAVRYSELNFQYHATETVPNDPMFSQLWGLKNTGQTGGTPGADIKATFAWDLTQGSRDVVVGVVDTGIDYRHADLVNNVWSNPGGVGGCGAGTHGYRSLLGVTSCDPLDDNVGIWHGTHVSGTIGAEGNNGIGVAGVNWYTTLVGLKFLSAAGAGFTTDAVTVIDFAITAKQQGVNIRVLSNSWGGGGYSQALSDEIQLAGDNDILFVAAAGNDGANNDTTPTYPCNYQLVNVVCVAATDHNDALASFSNYGAGSVHLGAPGVNIVSTSFGGTYRSLSGTSMATPHVAGGAALILSTGYLSVGALKDALLAAVDPDPDLAGRTVTGGRLNVCKGVGMC
jgi:subtilisin family serine protease